MTQKIFRSILLTVVFVLLLSSFVITGVLYNEFWDMGQEKLRDELSLAIHGVEINGEIYLESLENSNYRLTWVASDGTVFIPKEILDKCGKTNMCIRLPERRIMQSKKTDNQGITALYCRLSRDDGMDGDSNSVANQKKLMQKYAKENGFGNTRFYVDDGYTGTNFNRPGFQKMLEDIEMGYISTIIVKDMSRLGRDYLQVGYYTDTYFPDRNIRFIAINDCVDSADGENELAPFRNVMNEMYARDISRKVRSSHRIRGNSGEPLSQPPYGYLKSPDNKKRWVIDHEAAQIVRDVFRMCLEGKGNETIARILQEREVLVPMAYWQSKGLDRGGKKTQPNPYKWSKSTIAKMLAQQEYCGDVINFKTYSKSFKNKARIPNPEENWAIFKGVHEPIIDRETFELVQELVGKTKRRSTKEKNMFSDLLYCADCGSKLWYHVKQDKELIHYFSCSN